MSVYLSPLSNPVKHLRNSFVTFCSAVLTLGQASAAVVINEIHYNPDVKTEPAEFVELYNAGTNTVNLAGFYFSDGLNYTFPAVTIPAGGFRVLAQNPAFLQTKFGLAARTVQRGRQFGPLEPRRETHAAQRGRGNRRRSGLPTRLSLADGR